MRRLLFFLGLLIRRQQHVNGETDFLGYEAFPWPTGTNGSTKISPADKAGPRTSSFADQRLSKAA